MTWLLALLKYLTVTRLESVNLYCDNQVALHIMANLVFHEATKHIEVDCHYVRDKFKTRQIKPTHVHSKNQLIDILTKITTADQYHKLLVKFGVADLYQPQT